MCQPYYLISFLTLICYSVCAQHELKLYGGGIESPGIAYEYLFPNMIAIEVSGAFNSRETSSSWAGSIHGYRDNNLFINTFVKKYKLNQKEETRFFYGAYVRYWQMYSFKTGTENLTDQQKAFLDSTNTSISIKSQKISIGGLIGYRYPLRYGFALSLTGGIGYSPPAFYWDHITYYNHPDEKGRHGPDDWLGYLNHLSILMHFGVTYRFGTGTDNEAGSTDRAVPIKSQ